MKNLIAKIRKIAIVSSWGIIAIFGAFLIFVLTIPEDPEVAARKAAIEAEERAQQYMVGAAVRAIRGRLRDPSSLEVHKAILIAAENTICIIYGAKNGFGGMNREYAAFVDGSPASYEAACNGKSGQDYTPYAKYY